jgi:ATP-binding cassette subfamily B protein
MTSSAEPARGSLPEKLPPALSSMWRLCRLGYEHEPRLLVAAFLLSLLGALPDALIALWLALLGDAVIQQNRPLMLATSLGLGISATATWFLRTVSTRVQRRFRDKVTIALESHVARLQASVATIAHQERPEYLDRLPCCATRCSCSTTCTCRCSRPPAGSCGSASPSRCWCRSPRAGCSRCSPADVLTSTWRPAVERAAEERGAAAAGWPATCSAPPPPPARQGGAGHRHRRPPGAERRAPGSAGTAGGRGPLALGAWHALAWAVFGGGYVGAVVYVPRAGRPAGRRAAGAGRPRAAVGYVGADEWARSASCAHLDGRLPPPG